MKVLNFEDSVYKANAIRKVLNQCGVAKIELVSNVEDGLQMLKNAEDAGATVRFDYHRYALSHEAGSCQ